MGSFSWAIKHGVNFLVGEEGHTAVMRAQGGIELALQSDDSGFQRLYLAAELLHLSLHVHTLLPRERLLQTRGRQISPQLVNERCVEGVELVEELCAGGRANELFLHAPHTAHVLLLLQETEPQSAHQSTRIPC